MQVGDAVWARPSFAEPAEGEPLETGPQRGKRALRKGTVVYIHPLGRFYCVEFEPLSDRPVLGDPYQPRARLRECFFFRKK